MQDIVNRETEYSLEVSKLLSSLSGGFEINFCNKSKKLGKTPINNTHFFNKNSGYKNHEAQI